MFTWCDRRDDRSQLCDRPCYCRTDYTDWSQSHQPAKWCDTWNVEEFLKLIEIVKNYPVLWQTDHKEYGGMGQREAWCCYTSVLHICCTMWANGSLRSAEMRNFSAAECRKAMKGNLRSVLHLIFCKLPLDNFPHSVKYPHPLGGELLPLSNKLFWVRDPHPNSAPYP